MKQELKKKKTNAKRNAKRRAKRRGKKLIWTLVILLIAGVAGFLCKHVIFDQPEAEILPVSGDDVEIHFIDIGQGDAILIRTTEGDVLIDSGDNGKEKQLTAYLRAHHVDELEYVVFTHPDADHIGGSDEVLESYDVKRVLRPDYDSTSKTYQTMQSLIKAERCEDILSEVGYEFTVAEVRFTVLAPIGSIKNNNDASVVLRMDYGEFSALLTGDAELNSEAEMLEKYGDQKNGLLDCDLLKVGHHGSDSSSGRAFLKAVTPELAIISCGEDNDYNHPHISTMNRFEDMDIPVLRTDRDGSIAFTTDGTDWKRIAREAA